MQIQILQRKKRSPIISFSCSNRTRPDIWTPQWKAKICRAETRHKRWAGVGTSMGEQAPAWHVPPADRRSGWCGCRQHCNYPSQSSSRIFIDLKFELIFTVKLRFCTSQIFSQGSESKIWYGHKQCSALCPPGDDLCYLVMDTKLLKQLHLCGDSSTADNEALQWRKVSRATGLVSP